MEKKTEKKTEGLKGVKTRPVQKSDAKENIGVQAGTFFKASAKRKIAPGENRPRKSLLGRKSAFSLCFSCSPAFPSDCGAFQSNLRSFQVPCCADCAQNCASRQAKPDSRACKASHQTMNLNGWAQDSHVVLQVLSSLPRTGGLKSCMWCCK